MDSIFFFWLTGAPVNKYFYLIQLRLTATVIFNYITTVSEI